MSVNVALNFSLLVYFDVVRHGGLLNFKKGYPGLIFWHSVNSRRQADLSEWGSRLIYEVVDNDRASCLLHVHWVYWFMRGAGGSWVNVQFAGRPFTRTSQCHRPLTPDLKRVDFSHLTGSFWVHVKSNIWRNPSAFLRPQLGRTRPQNVSSVSRGWPVCVKQRDPFNTSLNSTVAPDLLNKMTKRGGTKQTAFIIIFWSYLHLLLTKHGMWRNLNVFLKCNRTDMCFFFFPFTGFFFLFFSHTHMFVASAALAACVFSI